MTHVSFHKHSCKLADKEPCVDQSPAQEVDIEILTSSALRSTDSVPEGVWFSNHPLESGQKAVTEYMPFGFDPSEDFHEYRIDVGPSLRNVG